jgi:hypothetical protein
MTIEPNSKLVHSKATNKTFQFGLTQVLWYGSMSTKKGLGASVLHANLSSATALSAFRRRSLSPRSQRYLVLYPGRILTFQCRTFG